MKKLILACAAVAIASSAPGFAAPKKSADDKPADKPNNGKGNDQDNRETGRSQGDLHASLKAIANVCTKDTPAANRSALCTPKPASPN